MYWRGHVGLSLLANAPLVGWLLAGDRVGLAAAVVSVAILFATLPDADDFLSIPHRGLTHTVWFVVGISAAVGGAAAALVPILDGLVLSDAVVLAAAVGLTLASHLAGDVLTPMGIRPFEPLFDYDVSLNVTPAKAPAPNRLLLALGLVAVVIPVVLL